MVIFPGAKINIGLNITAKRSDGYHDLESIFFPIPLSDILEINKSTQFSIDFSGLPIAGTPEDNLILKAYRLIAERYKIGPVKIHLHKIVPMGAGLGGGSADGAATLVLLNSLFELNISTTDLEKMAQLLGSDCPFFIRNRTAYAKGTGNDLQLVDLNLEDYWIQLINPGIHVSTKLAFSQITPSESNFSMRETILSPMDKWKEKLINDFEAGIFAQHPAIETVKTALYANGAVYASMTGTGSSVYGLFNKKPQSLLHAAAFSSYYEWISSLKKE